jgi:hypothetical protein
MRGTVSLKKCVAEVTGNLFFIAQFSWLIYPMGDTETWQMWLFVL